MSDKTENNVYSGGNTGIEVQRDGGWTVVKPGELTAEELCEALCWIKLDSDELVPDREIKQGYAAINEAISRLRKLESENAELKEKVKELEYHIDDLWQEIPEKAPRRAVGGCA